MDITEEEPVTITKDEEGNKFYNDYKLLRKYGEGSVGKVVEVVNTKTQTHYALKIVNKMLLKMRKEYVRVKKNKMGIKTAFDAVEREIEIIKMIDSEYVVKLHEILADEDDEKLYLVLDNCEKGEIMRWDADTRLFSPCTGDNYFSEEDIKGILHDTIQGLIYLHNIGIVHRDIKPHNLLMTHGNHIKICDFGVAQKVKSKEEDTLKSTEGTYHYMPPECWNFEVTEFSGVKADVWALGVTLYNMAYNRMPFWADSELELSNVILSEEVDYNQEREISSDLKQLIGKLLEKDPTKRPDLCDLLENDPFLTK